MCEIKRMYGDMVIMTAQGKYSLHRTGCGQALVVKNMKGDYVTAFSFEQLADEARTYDTDVMLSRMEDTICGAVVAHEVTRKLLDKGLFDEQVRATMKREGIEGDVLVAA